MSVLYSFNVSLDTPNNKVHIATLNSEITASSIVIALDTITYSDDNLDITMKAALSSTDETTLNNIVSNHTGEDLVSTEMEVDSDGRQIVKSARTYKGWRYLAHGMCFTTSKLGISDPSWDNTDSGFLSIKFYDSNNTELIAGTQSELDSNCVKTIVTFAPSYDIDVIGGKIYQRSTPTEDVCLWVIAGATDLSHLPDTIKEFVRNINLKDISNNNLRTDGRASARMNLTSEGVPVPTNKMQFIIRHPVGFQHDIKSIVEYYRE